MDVCNFDTRFVDLTAQGVSSHWSWPVNYPEIQKKYVSLMDGIVNCIRKAGPQDKRYNEAVILSLYYGIELIDVYKSALIVEDVAKSNLKISYGRRFPIISSFYEQHPISLNRGVVARLMGGFLAPNKLHSISRACLNLMLTKKDLIKRSPLRVNFEKDLVTCVISSMSKAYARMSEQSFFYIPVDHFFPTADKITPASFEVSDSALIQSMLGFSRDLFQCFSLSTQQIANQYFHDWFQTAVSYVDAYYTSMVLYKPLPYSLCMGTCGSIWNRILARYIFSKQGSVIRFDHGAGNGFYASPLQQKHFDFEDCTEFVTYSKAQADIYSQSFDRSLTVLAECPKITYFSMRDVFVSHQKNKKLSKKKKEKLTVMIVLNFFRGEGINVYSMNHFSDISLLDFVTRLSYRLLGLNYDVLIKPHPSKLDAQDPTLKLIAHFPDKITLEPFEKVYQQRADIIIFFHPATTIFPILMLSNKPLVYLNFSSMTFHEKAEEMMRKRCVFVDGTFTDTNKADINWESLESALQESQRRLDTEFSATYY